MLSLSSVWKLTLGASFFLALFARGTSAEPLRSLEAEIDPLFASLGQETPGAIVLVAQEGKVLLEKGYGMANIAAGIPIGAGTRFRIGSITKQFTAAAILKLQEQGKLNVQDRLSKYLPDWPRGDEVTLYRLLTHTSGIHDYTHQPDFAANAPQSIALADLIGSFKNSPYDFAPGSRFLYDNSGYVLLKYVVEKISGETYEHFLHRTFFLPLGMKQTGIFPSEESTADHALGYAFEQGAVRRAMDWHPSRLAGAGELSSTAHDLFLWNEALFTGQVLSAASLKAAFAIGAVQGDDPTHPEEAGYGFGWIVDTLRGEREISHGGELAGFGSNLLRLPERRLTVVVLLNCVPQLPTLHQWNVSRDIAARVLNLPPASPPKIFTAVSTSDLTAIVGRYEMGDQQVMNVTAEARRVFFEIAGRPRTEIFPRSDRDFFVAGGAAEATFVRGTDGKVVKAILKQGGARIDAPKLP